MHQPPGIAAVVGTEDHRVVPHGPASVLVVHVHRGEQRPGRHLRLLPACAVVVGNQDVATLARHHDARTGHGRVKQQGRGRQRRLHRRFGVPRGLGGQTNEQGRQPPPPTTKGSWAGIADAWTPRAVDSICRLFALVIPATRAVSELGRQGRSQLRHSRETGRVKTPSGGGNGPRNRHSREKGCVKTPSERGNGPRIVIPAKAGIQAGWSGGTRRGPRQDPWIPASAGMTYWLSVPRSWRLTHPGKRESSGRCGVSRPGAPAHPTWIPASAGMTMRASEPFRNQV